MIFDVYAPHLNKHRCLQDYKINNGYADTPELVHMQHFSILVHRCRRRARIDPTLGEGVMLAGEGSRQLRAVNQSTG